MEQAKAILEVFNATSKKITGIFIDNKLPQKIKISQVMTEL